MNYFQVKHIRSLSAHKYLYLWLAEFWTVLVTVLCLVSFSKLPSLGLQSADKFVHFTFHFIFTLLWYIYLKKRNAQDSKTLVKVFAASLIFGILIEFAQSAFTKTRNGDIVDVMANAAGSLMAVISIVLYVDYIKKNSVTK